MTCRNTPTSVRQRSPASAFVQAPAALPVLLAVVVPVPLTLLPLLLALPLPGAQWLGDCVRPLSSCHILLCNALPVAPGRVVALTDRVLPLSLSLSEEGVNDKLAPPSLWDCPETIFTNAAAERGIHEHIAEAISACDQTDRMELYHNVVIAGGTSCFQGFEDRLSDELTAYGT